MRQQKETTPQHTHTHTPNYENGNKIFASKNTHTAVSLREIFICATYANNVQAHAPALNALANAPNEQEMHRTKKIQTTVKCIIHCNKRLIKVIRNETTFIHFAFGNDVKQKEEKNEDEKKKKKMKNANEKNNKNLDLVI